MLDNYLLFCLCTSSCLSSCLPSCNKNIVIMHLIRIISFPCLSVIVIPPNTDHNFLTKRVKKRRRKVETKAIPYTKLRFPCNVWVCLFRPPHFHPMPDHPCMMCIYIYIYAVAPAKPLIKQQKNNTKTREYKNK
ncbi:hypothetical protein QBC43DRAFT_123561 [Cladorrhinum sp. PSN259]|nr:hypothetical protein QBC43DRAFT_123561 [Cladorrhinum sp. PSN259]